MVFFELEEVTLNKYIQMAKQLGMSDAKIISSKDIFFDPRAILKCRWGCDDYSSQKCDDRGLPYKMRLQIVRAYNHILLLHSNDGQKLYSVALKIERQVFLDGFYFAFTLCSCKLCTSCKVEEGIGCPTPEEIRPCDQLFGIDVYKTVRKQGLPCEVLQNKDEKQNRYAFILIA